MNNHCFETISSKRYSETRGASNQIFDEIISYIVKKKIISGKAYSILILGPNNGNNDLIPLLSKLSIISNSSFVVTAIDDSFDLPDTECAQGNVKFLYYKGDLEDYSLDIYKQTYDIVISFFVLHHLTNWELCILHLSKCLSKFGSLFILEYNDIEIQSFEGNIPKEKFYKWYNYSLFEEFHNKRFKEFGTFYESILLGSNTDFLKNFVGDSFRIYSKIFTYKKTVNFNDINQKFKTLPVHTPLYWGQNKMFPSEKCTNKYISFINSLPYKNNISGTVKSYIKLFEYKKVKEFELEKSHYNQNFSYLYHLLTKKFNQSGKFQEAILLQTILSSQTLVRETKIITPLFWKPIVTAGGILKDFNQGSFLSLVASRNFLFNIISYRLHIKMFRSTPFSEIIFNKVFSGYNWLWQRGENFSIYNKSIGEIKFIVITLPVYAIKSDFFKKNISNSFEYITFNNYILTDIEHVAIDDDELNPPLIIDIESTIRSFLHSNNYHLSDDLFNLFIGNIYKFSFLLNIGNCCYLTNEVNLSEQTNFNNGGLFLCEEDLNISKIIQDQFTSQRIKLLKEAINLYSYNVVPSILISDLKTNYGIIEHFATRAAISQVMARNMSHNIGSHVLSKLIKWFQLNRILKEDKKWQYVEDYKSTKVEEKLFDDIQKVIGKLKPGCDLKDGCTEISNCIDAVIKLLDINEIQVFHNYLLLATFFHYLKARMDYLADVTTNTPVIENTLGIYHDIIKRFIQNRVLNDRISGIDDFKYKIIICKPNHNDDGNQQSGDGKDCKETVTSACQNQINENTNDVTLSIPNDILGSQAIYTILENIIRNTAKHGSKPNGKYTEFKIKVEEASLHKKHNLKNNIQINKESEELDWDEYYAISIFDNCDLSPEIVVNSFEYNGEEAIKVDKYKEKQSSKIVVDDGNGKSIITIRKIDKLVIDQNHWLNKSILKNNQLRNGAWGLIEMDASAAYLRKIDNELIDFNKYQITCLHGNNPVTAEGELAILQAYAEQGKYLGYRFFIRKPQEILIVGDDEDLGINQMSIENKKALFNKYKNDGVWIYDNATFKEFFDNKQQIFPHKLVVLVKADMETKKLVEENNACFSKRIYIAEDDVSEQIKEYPLDLKFQLWKKYYKSSCSYSYFGEDLNIFISNNKKQFVDKHGKTYCEHYAELDKFIEIWTSATAHYFPVSYPKSINEKILELQEIASKPIEILVIDERIQEFASNRYAIEKNENQVHKIIEDCRTIDEDRIKTCFHIENGVPYQIIYKRTNIKVPEKKVCNLNAQNFRELELQGSLTNYKKIIDYIQESIKNIIQSQAGNNNHFFIVIHLGIIEKLIIAYNDINNKNIDKDNKEQTKEFVMNVILNKGKTKEEDFCNFYDNIVITSGRGTPQNIPQGIRYLNFSIISQYLITLRNKYAFTEALYTARKTN